MKSDISFQKTTLQKLKEQGEDIKKLWGAIQDIRKEQKEYHNQHMNMLDKILGELANIREDNTVGAYQIKDVRDEIYDHEKRIKALEKNQASQ